LGHGRPAPNNCLELYLFRTVHTTEKLIARNLAMPAQKFDETFILICEERTFVKYSWPHH
jgi:hypothetical protein